ncbi:hypothetical protein JJC04_11960 [Flavobacterium covae]|nr:hypothetical protein JJC04_11960 [Flavobacterium covae]
MMLLDFVLSESKTYSSDQQRLDNLSKQFENALLPLLQFFHVTYQKSIFPDRDAIAELTDGKNVGKLRYTISTEGLAPVEVLYFSQILQAYANLFDRLDFVSVSFLYDSCSF